MSKFLFLFFSYSPLYLRPFLKMLLTILSHCISQLIHYFDKIPQMIELLGGKGFILFYTFKGFSLWLLDL